MGGFTALSRRVRALFRKNQIDAELEKELRLHLELETEKNVRTGLSADEARRRARIAFGSVEAVKESHRDGRRLPWLEDFVADVRYGVRGLRRAPTLATAAIITLALGIGANTAIFSAVNAVILRPLPFANADRLVMLWESNPQKGWVNETAAPANMLDWKEQVRSFADIGAYASFTGNSTLTGVDQPRQVVTIRVTGNLFSTLGIQPAVGQLFRDEETWATGENNVMLTFDVWRRLYASDTAIAGRLITLDGRPARVVGVLPRNFEIPGVHADVWRPFSFQPVQRTQAGFRRAHWMKPIARLKNGVTADQAAAELQVVIARLQREYPATNTLMGGGFTPLQTFLTGDTRRPLLVLLGAVALLLLIACANVGNLLLVRAADREREFCVRLALGAKRSRLFRQALTESLVLSLAGGVAGFLLGVWCTRLFGTLRPAGLLPTTDIPVSWSVLAYITALTTGSGLLFGIAPAIWSRRRSANGVLRDATRGASSGRRVRRWSEALVVAEVAIALFLTTGAGLLGKSLWKLQRVDAGVDTRGVLTTTIALPFIRYDSDAKVNQFWDQVVRRIGATPGVTAVSTVSKLALTGPSWSSDFTVEGWPADKFGNDILHRDFAPGYTDVMHVPVLRGRVFTEADALGAPGVVIVNDAIARRYFPNEDPVGKRLTFNRVADTASIWYTIVGVVGSERQDRLSQPPRGEIFQPGAQRGLSGATLVIRTQDDPNSLIPALRQVVADLDPNLALADLRTMEAVRAESAARQRFLTILLVVFAGVGVALAVVGVYGVMAHVARGRTREMGIRIALGAQTGEVRGLVVRRGLVLASLGVAIGLAGALAGAQALKSVLFDVRPVDPVTFVVVPVLLTGVALLACWIPAVRASRADPVQALRGE